MGSGRNSYFAEFQGVAALGFRALQELPDLVLMDINMPGIDGLEATRRLTSARPDVAVIVFSTHSPTEFESRALDAGAIGFITKSELVPERLTELWYCAPAHVDDGNG